MASPPPAYDTPPSLDAISIAVQQTTHSWPTRTALLPRYSTSSSSCWMTEKGLEILGTTHNFDAARLICEFVPGLEPTVAADVLSKRQEGWLGAFLKVLCRRQAIQEPSCNSLLSRANAIVGIIRRRPLLPASVWDGVRILSALNSSGDISVIAEQLDTQIHSNFYRIISRDWLEWYYGFPNDPIQSLLHACLNLRNDLARSVQEHTQMFERLQSLQELLPSRHPLTHWIVSTAMESDTLSSPSEALRFFVDIINQLDKDQSSGILSVIQRFSILNTRYELYITSATDVKWPKPFPTNFSFWESVQRDSALDLAKSNTDFVCKLFRGLAAGDVLDGSEYMKDIERQWSDLSIDILACLVINGELKVYFEDFAKHLLDLDLNLRNVYSAAAIGLALQKWRYQPQNAGPSRVWNIINPTDNYAGCRKFMAENAPCLPFLFPCVTELRQSKNASSKIMELFQFLAYFGRREREVMRDVEKQVVRQGATANRSPQSYLPSSSPTKRAQQKPVQCAAAAATATEDPFSWESIVPSTWHLINAVNWEGMLNPKSVTLATSDHSPQQNLRVSRKGSSSQHAISKCDRSIIHPRGPEILATEATDEEQSDFLLYSGNDLGETLEETRVRFAELFGKTAPNQVTRKLASTCIARRRLACKAKSRLVDVAPHRASKYHWVEKYHKQEISEACLGQETLSSAERELLRPLSVEALDFLWFLHFDLGVSGPLLLNTFWPRYHKDDIGKAHLADFKRRGISMNFGYTANSQMRTGPSVMSEAYDKMYRLCDIQPDAIEYRWIPEIFKFGMRYPCYRHQAFQEYITLSKDARLERMTRGNRGSLTFPGLADMPKSTFHYSYSREQPENYVTRLCAGRILCNSEGEKCDGLQFYSMKEMTEESSAMPLDPPADIQQTKPEVAVSECQRPAEFYLSPSTKPYSMTYKRANGITEGFWHIEEDDGRFKTWRMNDVAS